MYLNVGKCFGVDIYLSCVLIGLCGCFLVVAPPVLFIVLTVWTIVIAHEFGHIFAARYCGFETESITLEIIGGIASIKGVDQATPKQEFFITVCGPLVNVCILLAMLPFVMYTTDYPIIGSIRQDLSLWDDVSQIGYKVNCLMLMFNMIPAWPLDGGRIFRSSLSILSRNHLVSSKIAFILSQFISAGLFVFGLLTVDIMLVIIFALIGLQATFELVEFMEKKNE